MDDDDVTTNSNYDSGSIDDVTTNPNDIDYDAIEPVQAELEKAREEAEKEKFSNQNELESPIDIELQEIQPNKYLHLVAPSFPPKKIKNFGIPMNFPEFVEVEKQTQNIFLLAAYHKKIFLFLLLCCIITIFLIACIVNPSGTKVFFVYWSGGYDNFLKTRAHLIPLTFETLSYFYWKVLFPISILVFPCFFLLYICIIKKIYSIKSPPKNIKGAKFETPEKYLEKCENKKLKMSLPFGNIKLPQKYEIRNILCIGEIGSGKTNALNQIIEHLIEQDKSAIIYDVKGELMRMFFRPGIDLIFNPLDKRSLRWTIFNDILLPTDTLNVAKVCNPTGGKSTNEYWTNAARTVFSGIIEQLINYDLGTNGNLWKILSNLGKTTTEQLQGHDTCSSIRDPDSKVAQTIFSVINVNTRSLRYLKDGNFSIKKWLKKPKGNIFITSQPTLSEALKPLLSLFIEVMAKEILSMHDDENRRLFYLLDEFGTLSKIPSVVTLYKEGRSKGCSIFNGIQDPSQLENIYGKEDKKTIINASGTKIFLKVSADTGTELSDIVGKEEKKENTVSYSHKFGFSTGEQIKRQKLIMGSEFTGQKDLHATFKTINSQWIKIFWRYKKYPIKNKKSFIFRDDFKYKKSIKKLANVLNLETKKQSKKPIKKKDIEFDIRLENVQKKED